MAGIYIHVPYCKTRCIYCDFFTQTNTASQTSYVTALCEEIKLRKYYTNNEIVRTIYFGGGTPSLLCDKDFEKIFTTIYATFTVSDNVEISLEANPDDLTAEYLSTLRLFPFNRLSIGVQSFDDVELKFLNRRHSAAGAIKAVKLAQDAGFDNISIDLMYGLPNQTIEIWRSNLEMAISLGIQHISSYHLIYEEGTKLYRLFKKGEVNQVAEDLSVDMFSIMIDKLSKAGFEHYEISNFAKDGLYSKHNTSYWQGVKYLGLGPAAHSFDGKDRAFNIASISKYIEGVDKGVPVVNIEVLDINSQYNDYILTGMRTKWGVNLDKLADLFGQDKLKYCLENVQKHIVDQSVRIDGNKLLLTHKGIFISDGVMSDLMWV